LPIFHVSYPEIWLVGVFHVSGVTKILVCLKVHRNKVGAGSEDEKNSAVLLLSKLSCRCWHLRKLNVASRGSSSGMFVFVAKSAELEGITQWWTLDMRGKSTRNPHLNCLRKIINGILRMNLRK
jgi:hypothetical protein